jgi:peptidoglycan/xylan/chitin deacetylase (PgdA/CDA1 family)
MDVPASYHTLGMTIELEALLNRLRNLHSTNLTNGTTSYVTFDDGWRDVLQIPKDFFHQHSSLQPVVFLTDEQFRENPRSMPLHTLYRWMEEKGYMLCQLSQLGIDRTIMKDWREDDQHTSLQKQDIDIDEEPDYLRHQDLEILTQRGWKIASHGPEHSDLRTLPSDRLRAMLEESLTQLHDAGAEPWLAWPEGRWNDEVAALAHEVGFTKQFGLKEEPRKGTSSLVEMRTLW